jgi:hypothetical protein
MLYIHNCLSRRIINHKIYTEVYIYIYCTMLGVYLISSAPIVHVTPLTTPFGLLIPLFQSQSHVTTIAHNYLLRCYLYTIIITYTFVTTVTWSTLARLHSLRSLHSNSYCTIAHKVSYVRNYHHLAHSCTGWLLSYQLLCRIITHTLHLNTSKLSPRSHSEN